MYDTLEGRQKTLVYMGVAQGRHREAADRVLVTRLHARVGTGRGDHEHELHGRRLRG